MERWADNLTDGWTELNSYDPLALKTAMVHNSIKGALSCLRQFLPVESPLKMMKNAFYSM